MFRFFLTRRRTFCSGSSEADRLFLELSRVLSSPNQPIGHFEAQLSAARRLAVLDYQGGVQPDRGLAVLGATLSLSGRTDEAVRVLRDRAEQPGCGPTVLLTLVRVLLEAGASPGDCAGWVEQAVRADVNNEAALGMLSHLARSRSEGAVLERVWRESGGQGFIARAMDGSEELLLEGRAQAARAKFLEALEVCPDDRLHEVMMIVLNACAEAHRTNKHPEALALALDLLPQRYPPKNAVVPVGVALTKVAQFQKRHDLADSIISTLLKQPKEHQEPQQSDIRELLRNTPED
jgi:hypothetical protein